MISRELWLDIAKGIGIICVVLGHSGNLIAHHYLFWFHMPFFFIVSGYLYKNVATREDLVNWILKRAKQLLIPYFSFGILIIIIMYLNGVSKPVTFELVKNLFYGGEYLTGYLGVFWFITCLFLTQTLFAIIVYYIQNKYLITLVLMSCYTISIIFMKIPIFQSLKVYWNADVVLIAIIYYAIGYFIKNKIQKVVKDVRLMVVNIVCCISLIFLDLVNVLAFTIDMKINIYGEPILNIFIPLIFSILIFQFSYVLSEFKINKVLGIIGNASLTIMYLHIPVNLLLGSAVNGEVILYVIVGLVAPLLIHYFIFEKFFFTKKLFLGIYK